MKQEEEGMSKYGVDQNQSQRMEKYASRGCPNCGTRADKLVKYGSVILCPNCGSEPFEKKGK